jgi:muramoyltetrapeptide carboxypeptidase
VPHSRFAPEALAAGARVALIAPAGPLRDQAELDCAIANAESLGWSAVVGENAMNRRGYFAGSEDERLRDINDALRDPAVDAIWCLRGGYGAMRLLPSIDYEALRDRPRWLIGYSDITALHAAFGEGAGIVTLHGPTARQPLTSYSRDSLAAAVSLGNPFLPIPTGGAVRTIRGGQAAGRLAGGNLAVLSALCGTPYFPDLRGTLLILEDIGEAVYRVDRMLRQLLLAGVMNGVQAIAFGHCTNCAEEAGDGSRSLDEVLTEIADAVGIPCVRGVPIGHIDDQWTVPLGSMAEFDAGTGALSPLVP